MVQECARAFVLLLSRSVMRKRSIAPYYERIKKAHFFCLKPVIASNILPLQQGISIDSWKKFGALLWKLLYIYIHVPFASFG